MSVEPILALIVVAVVANLVVMAALLGSPVLGRSRALAQQDYARRCPRRGGDGRGGGGRRVGR